MKNHHTVAGMIFGNALADGGNYARSFVSKDAGGGMGTGRNLFEVSAADPARVHAEQHFSGTNLRDRDGLHADVIYAAIHCGLHRCRNGLWRVFHRLGIGSSHVCDFR